MSLPEKCWYSGFSGRHFPGFGLNTGKYGPEKLPNTEIFYAVYLTFVEQMRCIESGWIHSFFGSTFSSI